jgi:undecaprenyl-diphosphatase
MKNNKFLGILILSLVLFLPLAYLAHTNNYFPLDLKITNSLQGINDLYLRNFLIFISIPGYGIYKFVILISIVIFLLFKKLKKEVVMLVFASIGAEAISYFLKLIIFRTRPAQDLIEFIYKTENSPSFPSGHVVLYVGFFGFLFYLSLILIKDKMLRLVTSSVCLLFILVIGVSRIYLGAHWFSDVVGGYLLGIFWLMLSILLYNAWLSKKNEKESENKTHI